ncbi:MAG: sulfatase [Planctomycetota bacterium]|jgi:arylsulfatase A-like enzyme|nr:sulfatase [Planctomycetota bacterium]MDP6989132.1 sulfatase [Planctomycetota bacterium]
MPPVRRIAAVVAAALTWCCGEAAPPDPPPAVRRFELEASAPDEPGEVRRLEVPAEMGAWNLSSGQARIAPDDDRVGGTPGFRLALLGEGSKQLHMPLEFDARKMHRVVVAVSTPSTERFWVHLVRADGSARSSPVVTLEGSPSPQVLQFYMPRKRAGDEPFEELVFVAAGLADFVVLHGGIELSRVQLASWDFATDGNGERLLVRHETREARLLAPSSRLKATIEAAPTDEVAFSLGVPEVFRNPSATGATVRLVATDVDGDRREWAFAIERLAAEPGWRSERVALAGFSPGPLELEFTLDSPSGIDIACLVAESRIAAPRADPATVLLITSDTHRGDHLGAAGSAVAVSTPVLDALAARGVLFEDCFTSTNTTNPSHIALMTAFHPRDTAILTNDTPVSEAAPTLAEAFGDAGYRTFAAVSTRHLGDPTSGLGQGFDRMAWPGASDRPATETIEALKDWLPDAEGEPLFCWLHLFDAHIPYEPPPEFARLYYPAERDAFDPSRAVGKMPPARVLHESLLGLTDPAYPAAMYRGEVSSLDDALGGLLECARLTGAIVAFTSDHGESLGQHGIFFSHGDLYPDSIHVPLILAWPGAPAGTRVARPAAQMDVGRTLLDLAGHDHVDFPGRNLLPPLDTRPPRFALAGNATSASLTHDGWHLMLHLRPHSEPPRLVGAEWHAVELYNLAEDPGCTIELSAQRRELAGELRARLIRWLCSARDLGWARDASADPELLAELARLGYTERHEAESVRELIDPDCECERCAEYR